MDKDTDNLIKSLTGLVDRTNQNFANFFGWSNDKLQGLKNSIDILNVTIAKASKSSSRVAWALWGVTMAGVLIAAAQYFKK